MGIVASERREFEFSHADFNHLRLLVKETTGINLTEGKYNMVYGRISRRLRALKLSTFREYRSLLEAPQSNELPELTNAITTNLTSFFREQHHFDRLQQQVLSEVMAWHELDRRLRVWSAGCSTGEEPYSLAMVMAETIPQQWGDVKLLATDLDTRVVAHASAGRYEQHRVEGIGRQRLSRWMQEDGSGHVDMAPALRSMITFKPLNLLHQWPMRGPFDVIFCRNVVIYFDKPTQRELFNRFADILTPGGYLFIGHSETLFKVCDRFESLGNTVYRKLG
ncbi:MAG TPA: chemotaxis protein CheR [Gammaproteobacteria bacterium]|nr:chemotaxis protein CheR [Gammaproteobacteria bacterium]